MGSTGSSGTCYVQANPSRPSASPHGVRLLMRHQLCSALMLLIAPAAAWACSPPPVEFFEARSDDNASYPVPTTAPVARVASISRGHRARGGESTCSELASITIAVRDDSPGVPFVFSFRQVSGTAPDAIFFSGLHVGGSNGDGELLFGFYWPDLTDKPLPIDIQVEVTPHSRAGAAGPSTTLAIRDGV